MLSSDRTAEKNSLDVARILIEHGAEIDAGGQGGKTPLDIAAKDNSPDVLRLLVDSGADVSGVREHKNFFEAKPYPPYDSDQTDDRDAPTERWEADDVVRTRRGSIFAQRDDT